MKKLLIVVDFQNDFVDGSLGFPKAVELDHKIAEKIKEYRKCNSDIIFTFDTHGDDYINTVEGKHLPVPHCIKGTNGHKLYGEVGKLFDEKSDIYFEKVTFPSIELAKYLENKNYDSVELCGLVSHICVLSNAVMVKASLPNAEIIIDKNLTSSHDESLNEQGFEVLKGLHVIIKE